MTSPDIDSKKNPAECRGCGLRLRGNAYMYGGFAYHPDTGKRCPSNHFGGFVCSPSCDRLVSLHMLSSMPGAGPAKTLDIYTSRSHKDNWPEYYK